ncbi:unnamed protein product [Ixodes pacificus]
MKILLLVAAFSLALAVANAGLIDGAIFVVLGGSAIAAGLLELGAFTHDAALSYGHVLPSDIHNELHEMKSASLTQEKRIFGDGFYG